MKTLEIGMKMFTFFWVVAMLVLAVFTLYEAQYVWTALFTFYAAVFTVQLNIIEKSTKFYTTKILHR